MLEQLENFKFKFIMKKIMILMLSICLTSCSFFNSGKQLKLIPYIQKGKYGYFNLEGKIVINPQFEFATTFREGLALVKTTGENGKWGYIDEDGKFVINASYKDATVFQEGTAWVVNENSAPTAIDKDGEVKFILKDAEQVRLFSDGLAAYSKSDSTSTLWGFVDKDGKQIINPQFYEVKNFIDGKCAVKNKEGKWGYINKTGKIVINYQFDEAEKFNDGSAIVFLDEKAGVIDEAGKYVINPQFQSISSDKDKYLVYQDEKAGWCDSEGKFIINPQFDYASNFQDFDLACVKSGDKYGYINKDGKIMINPQFDDASQFFNDVAIVKSGEKYGLIDSEGKYIVNPQFDEIGYDVYAFLNDNSIKNSVQTDYLDVNEILKVINVNSPENLTFNDSFQSILNKTNKTLDDFSSYSDINILFENKVINRNASYSFGFMGKLKAINDYDYSYYVANGNPIGFIYSINLTGRAYGKSESIQKSFEKKLANYSLVKKGYISNLYTSVYKSSNNYVVISSTSSGNVLIYVMNKDYEIGSYLEKIVDKKSDGLESEAAAAPEATYSDYAADTTAVDTTAYYD